MNCYTLENEKIKLTISAHGAEIKSLINKENNLEYMWKADPTYWGRTAPVLFPFVGSVRHKEYRTKGQTFSMGQHGFARDCEFQLMSQSADELWFLLESSSETKEKYPYDFRLMIGYHIHGATVDNIWKVENPAAEELPFSIGGHPAFYCPLQEGDSQTDCYFHFNVSGPLKSTHLEGGLTNHQYDIYPLEDSYLPISKHLFDYDALIIEQQQITEVSICDKHKTPYLTVTFDAPLFGLWSPVGKEAPFVCIEPWYGRCDDIDFTGNLQDRAYGNLLAPHETWCKQFSITV